MGRSNDHFTANINIDYMRQATGTTPDINLLVAGATDGCIFTDTTLNIRSGKIARILGGSIGSNTIIFNGYPLNLFCGSTTMNISGGDITEIFGSSLGRWTNEIFYIGQIQINISGGIIRSDIYGAGAASLTGNNPQNQYQYYNQYCAGTKTSTEINISGGQILGNVYGGGYGYSNYLTTDVREDGGALYGDSTINITGGTINGDIFGAGRGYNYTNKTWLAEMKGTSTINISGNPTITGNIYGAGEGVNGMPSMALLTGTSTINIDADLAADIYGGGLVGRVQGTTNVNIIGGNNTGTIYGGGSHGEITGNSNVTISGGTVNTVYSGGDLATVNDTTLTIDGGSTNLAYAGGNQATVRNTTVEVNDGQVTTLFGGGNRATANDTILEVNGGEITTLYGGGNEAGINSSNISVEDGTVGTMYGGGNRAGVNTTTRLDVSGGEVGTMFGGSNTSGNVSETTVIIEGGVVDEAYGGNNQGGSSSTTNVYICGGDVGDVYGGGNNVFVPTTNVYLRNTDECAGNIYGGGNNAGATTTNVYLQGGEAENVYGGSNSSGTVEKSNIIIGDENYVEPEPEDPDAPGGEEPDEPEVIEPRSGYAAYMNGTYYTTVAAALNATSNAEAKITMIADSNEILEIANGKNIILDLNGYTLSSNDTTITSRGNLTVNDSSEEGTGRLSTTGNSNSYYPILQYGNTFTLNGGALSSNYRGMRAYGNATVIMNGGSLTAPSGAGIGFEEPGTLEVNGGTITASSHAVYTSVDVDMVVTGGTIKGNTTGLFFGGAGTLTVGTKDGIVKEEPIIIGGTGINVTGSGTFNFYDGIAGGTGSAIGGNISEIEDSSTRQNGQRNIDGTTYNVTYLEGPTGGSEEPEEPEEPDDSIPSTIADFLNIANVFGGNNKGGQTTLTDVDCYSGKVGNIFGGGNQVNSPTTDVDIHGGTIGSVYGGSNQTGNVTTANVLIEGGHSDNVFGGNNAGGTTSNATVIINSGVAGDVYGGNNEGGLTENAYTEANGGTITNIFGGGNMAATNNATLNVNSANVLGNVYGGGNMAAVNSDTHLTLTGANITTNVYGGGNEGVVLGDTYARITDSTIDGSVYAGGNGVTAIVSGNTNLIIEGTTDIQGHAFGGGNQAATGTEGSNNSISTVEIAGGSIEGNVYGGANTSVVYGITNVNIGNTVSNIDSLEKADIYIGGTVFGGGEANAAGDENYDFSFVSVTNGTNINIDAEGYDSFFIDKSIFGSGNASTTTGESIINVSNYGTIDSPKSNVSIQRASVVTLDNCAIWLEGATDRTNEHSNVLFSLSRIDDLKMKNNSTLFMQNGANLLKDLSSLVDQGGVEVKETAVIDDNGNLTQNVDNRIYVREGVNINVAENEAATIYGDIHGMFFLGLYTGKNHLSLGIYSPDYENGDEIDLSDKLVFTRNSYVLGEHYEDHDITVDGFYTNVKTEDEKIKLEYIEPTPTDQPYYIWTCGELADAIIYEIQLTASKFNTLGTKQLPLRGFETPNTVFEYSGSSYDLIDGVNLVDKNTIKVVEDNQETADSKFGLALETSKVGWNMEGKTKFYSDSPYYDGNITYLSEHSTVTPVLDFYLYHSQNLSIQREIGTAVIAFTAIQQVDDLNKEVKNILIYVNMDTALYDDGFYESAITPGEKYELFTNTQTSITSDSQFSQYYSLMLEDFSSNDAYDGYENSYRTMVSSVPLPENTTITFIDMLTDSTEYYYYTVSAQDVANNKTEYDLADFKKMGSTNEYFDEDNSKYYASDLDIEHEEFIFHFDFSNADITEPIRDQTVFLENRDEFGETMFSVLGDLRESLVYSIYVTGSSIDVEAETSKSSAYLGQELYLDVTTSYNQNIQDGKVIYDTNYFGQQLGVKITFLDSEGEPVIGSSLLGVYFELDGQKYYPRTDGTTRLRTAETVSNAASNIRVITENSNLPSGNYTIKIEAFSSPDGIYYGLVSADEITVPLVILNSIYGLKVNLEDNMVIINSETGLTQNDNHDLVFNLEYASGIVSPNIKVGLYRRDYENVYSNLYNLVDMQDYVTNELTTTDINDIYLVTDSPSDNFDFELSLGDNLVTGTYKVVFSIYDEDVYIGEVYQYIIIN